MDGQALDNLRILEWGSFISAPFCTEMLAQLGAEVIKIEPPGGDEARYYGPFPGDKPDPEKSGLFLYLNLDKYGITLDPLKPTGREILFKLLEETDIFVVNQPQLDLAYLGLDYEVLKKRYPRLIMTLITPFGDCGPYRDWKGYDINSCTLGGITSTIGYPDRTPLTPPLHQGHHQAGLMAAIAILLAVLNRDKTGQGAFIDQSEADVWATIHIGMYLQAFVDRGTIRKRSGHYVPQAYVDAVLPCKDGSVCIDTPQKRQWLRFMEAMGNPAWMNDPIFEDRNKTTNEYHEEADKYLGQWLMEHTKEEIFKTLQDARVPSAPVRTANELLDDDHMKQREFFVSMDHPAAGKLNSYPGVCYKYSKTRSRANRPAPLLGEHNEAIYCQKLGYGNEELSRWQDEEVI
ncbi:MAG: CoA transferase [SAR324 cluster bacterium]|nr:CoA transferase [SAR324 cluster bacterium]